MIAEIVFTIAAVTGDVQCSNMNLARQPEVCKRYFDYLMDGDAIPGMPGLTWYHDGTGWTSKSKDNPDAYKDPCALVDCNFNPTPTDRFVLGAIYSTPYYVWTVRIIGLAQREDGSTIYVGQRSSGEIVFFEDKQPQGFYQLYKVGTL